MGENMFEEELTFEALSLMGNPLEQLSSLVDFEMFRISFPKKGDSEREKARKKHKKCHKDMHFDEWLFSQDLIFKRWLPHKYMN